MTEEEQAHQLYEDMFYKIPIMYPISKHDEAAKACAVIAAEKIIEELDEISLQESGTTKIDYGQSKWRRIKYIIKNI